MSPNLITYQARTQGGFEGVRPNPLFSLVVIILWAVPIATTCSAIARASYVRVRTFMHFMRVCNCEHDHCTAYKFYHDRLKLAIALSVPVVKLDPSAVIREQPRALLDTAKVEEMLD